MVYRVSYQVHCIFSSCKHFVMNNISIEKDDFPRDTWLLLFDDNKTKMARKHLIKRQHYVIFQKIIIAYPWYQVANFSPGIIFVCCSKRAVMIWIFVNLFQHNPGQITHCGMHLLYCIHIRQYTIDSIPFQIDDLMSKPSMSTVLVLWWSE